MDEMTLKEEEYEAQYYEDFTSTSFLVILKKIVEANVSTIFAMFEDHSKNSLDSESIKVEAAKNMMQAKEFFTKYLEIHLDKIKPMVKDFLSIPENIVFKCDELNEGFVDNIEALKSEYAELEHKLHQQKIYSTFLMEECNKLTQFMPLVDKMYKLIRDPDNQELKDINLLEETWNENQENQTQKPVWKLLKKKQNAWKYYKGKENK